MIAEASIGQQGHRRDRPVEHLRGVGQHPFQVRHAGIACTGDDLPYNRNRSILMHQRQAKNLHAMAEHQRPIQDHIHRPPGKRGQHMQKQRAIQSPHRALLIRQPAAQPRHPGLGFGRTRQKNGKLTQGNRLGLENSHRNPSPVDQLFAIGYRHDHLQRTHQSSIYLFAAAHKALL